VILKLASAVSTRSGSELVRSGVTKFRAGKLPMNLLVFSVSSVVKDFGFAGSQELKQ
jgi:hypothetical protein